ncbi:hypothetical protein [Gracilimonas sediminicola]|uniref:Type II toxin-antitoxin system RelE/ParE family toxin n=1 Tax=Gracilimonas sediminicola TaxID=2952158 RepID=A0A9X2L2K2_9BACT|nr:hypothetical protein [Gracilimonas sediminicola]MCP9291171.1 hypothetical protein [Gracilimonas sediminicola]
MKILILDSAKSDLVNGFYFYESQEQGLGDYFLDALYSDIDSLMLYAGVHSKKFGSYHCMFANRFPFAIYYIMKEDVVYVHAILDCRRDPDIISERLE